MCHTWVTWHWHLVWIVTKINTIRPWNSRLEFITTNAIPGRPTDPWIIYCGYRLSNPIKTFQKSIVVTYERATKDRSRPRSFYDLNLTKKNFERSQTDEGYRHWHGHFLFAGILCIYLCVIPTVMMIWPPGLCLFVVTWWYS